MDNESIMASETAQAYRVLCEFCSLMFTDNPSDDVLDQLIEQRALFKEDPFASVAQEASSALFEALSKSDGPNREAFKADVKRDYTYLFRMVGASHTSPYESVYRTDDRTMFGPTTLDVRDTYRAWGVQVPRQGSTPDDHIGYEFAFLAHVLGIIEKAGQREDPTTDASPGEAVPSALAHEAVDAVRAQGHVRSFLSDHLLVFAPVYLKNVQTRATEPFYRAVAAVAAGTIESLADALGARAAETVDTSAYLLTN